MRPSGGAGPLPPASPAPLALTFVKAAEAPLAEAAPVVVPEPGMTKAGIAAIDSCRNHLRLLPCFGGGTHRGRR